MGNLWFLLSILWTWNSALSRDDRKAEFFCQQVELVRFSPNLAWLKLISIGNVKHNLGENYVHTDHPWKPSNHLTVIRTKALRLHRRGLYCRVSFSIICISRWDRPGNICYTCIISNLYFKSYKISQLSYFTLAFSTIKQFFFKPHRKEGTNLQFDSVKQMSHTPPKSKAKPLEVNADRCASIWKWFLTWILCFLISMKKSHKLFVESDMIQQM